MRFLVFILFFITVKSATAQKVYYELDMRKDGTHELYTGEETNIWGFSFRQKEGGGELNLPSPTLTATEGDTVIVQVINPSDEGHTIHWHGLDVDQANDGVPHTSQFILTGDTFIYQFIAPHAGNYIYHCHVTTTLHLMMGMYGSFIVHPKAGKNYLFENGPQIHRDYDFLGSELDKTWNDDFMAGGPLNEFLPNHFLLNGLEQNQLFQDSSQIISLKKGELVGLRLLNIGFSIHKYTFPDEVTVLIYTSDGRKLPNPMLVKELEIYPGERYGMTISLNKNIQDYIEVDYLDMYEKRPQARNYIGINSFQFPLDIVEFENTNSSLIYPNPTTGIVNFQEVPKEKFRILNALGEGMKTFSPTKTVNLENWPNGFYWIETSNRKYPIVKN